MKNKADWASKAMSYIYGASVPVQPAKQEPKQKYQKPAVFNNEEASKNLRKQNKKRDDAAMAAIKSRLNQGTKRRHGGAVEEVAPPPPPVSCAYPLGATAAEMVPLGMAGQLTLSVNEQKGTYTTVGTNRTFGAFPTNIASPSTFDLTTGKKVIEWVIETSALVDSGGGGSVQSTVGIVSTAFASILVISITRNVDDGGLGTLRVSVNGTNRYEDPYDVSSGSTVIGAEFDSAGTVRVIVDGTPLTLSSDACTLSATAVHYQTIAENLIDTVDYNKTYSILARTQYDSIAQTYASGATDLCGNTLNG